MAKPTKVDPRQMNTPPTPGRYVQTAESTANIKEFAPPPASSIDMKPTMFNTIVLPGAGANTRPICIAKATTVPIRVVVDNLSAVTVLLGGTSGDVYAGSGPGTAVYRLSHDEVRTFVLAPKQSLFAAGAGAMANISVAISEAYPVG